jgi:hypothetical protein
MATLNRAFLTSAVLLITASGFAQVPGQSPPMGPPSGAELPGGPMRGGRPPLLLLAAQKSVQADLKLKMAQTQQIQKVDAKMRKAAMEAMRAGPQAMAATMESTLKDSEKELADILAKEQMTRLKQIATQLQGPQAALDSEVSEKLQLTKEQSNEIQSLTRKDEKKLSAILTEEQRTKWQEIVGRPFHGKITLPTQRMPPPRN